MGVVKRINGRFVLVPTGRIIGGPIAITGTFGGYRTFVPTIPVSSALPFTHNVSAAGVVQAGFAASGVATKTAGTAGTAAQNALGGAVVFGAAGAALGPIGAAAGAAVGGIVGVLTGRY